MRKRSTQIRSLERTAHRVQGGFENDLWKVAFEPENWNDDKIKSRFSRIIPLKIERYIAVSYTHLISAYNEEGNYIKDEDKAEKIKEIAGKEYTDIEDGEETAAVLNAYFELLPDESAGEFQGSESLSRAQAMACLLYTSRCV